MEYLDLLCCAIQIVFGESKFGRNQTGQSFVASLLFWRRRLIFWIEQAHEACQIVNEAQTV